MNVWAIVMMLGKIGGVAGPLPYDLEECELRAKVMNEEVQKQVASGKTLQGDPIPERLRSLKFSCVVQDVKPEITYKSEEN